MAGTVFGVYFEGDDFGFAGSDPKSGLAINGSYVAVGAFTAPNGLPDSINSVDDYHAYAQALLAKTTDVSADATTFRISEATVEFVAIGGSGADTIQADASDPGRGTLLGGAGNDTITGGSGADRVDGGADADSINGGAGADTLDGGAGGDVLVGGAGNDTLVSGGSRDFLAGGVGLDTYAFAAFNDRYVARIAGFDQGGASSDIVDVSRAAAALGFHHFTEVSAFDGEAGEMVAKFKPNGGDGHTQFLFDTDGDGRADYKIVVTHGDHHDFVNFVGVDTSSIVT